MEAATEEFLRDLDSATQTSTALPSKNAAVEAALHKYREVAKLKLALPLTQLDAAREEMEKFIRFRLKELQSQQETRHLVGELSLRITDHRSRELLGCLVAWISIMRRISSKSEAIKCQWSSRTRFSSQAWLMRCTR